MKFRVSIFVLGALLLAACSSVGTPSADVPADVQASPENVVEGFFALYMNGNRADALALVEPDSRDILDGQLQGMESEGWVYKSVKVESVEGTSVTVQMNISIDGEEDSGTDQVEVVEQDGKWWIMDLPS